MDSRPDLLGTIEHLVLDCDGVVYVGTEAVPGTDRLAAAARERGISVLFLTNDTTMSRHDLATAIRAAGIEAGPRDVLSAAWATALWCVESGIRHVALLGTHRLEEELVSAGIDVSSCMGRVPGSVQGVDAMVVGSAPELTVRDLDTALAAWERGMPIVAGNGDRTYPGKAGPRLGCGSLACALAHATGEVPVFVGKPEPIMFREAERLLGLDLSTPHDYDRSKIALLGDSVESDVMGANRAGWTSILLASGDTRTGTGAEPDMLVERPTDLLEEV